MLRYTIVKTRKINACRGMTSKWKIPQATCNKPAGIIQPTPALKSAAIRIKIISPAYRLPNNRKPREKGLANKPTTYINRLNGIREQ